MKVLTWAGLFFAKTCFYCFVKPFFFVFLAKLIIIINQVIK